jgi:hypothetical protein
MKPPSVFLAMSLSGILAATAIPALAQQAPAPPPAVTNPCMGPQMHEHMQRMQAMHEAMASAKTPQERAKLQDEQWQLMHQGMGMMRRMPGMGGGMGMQGGMGMHQGTGGMGMCMGERMAMMEMMMQMMMDRMGPEPVR